MRLSNLLFSHTHGNITIDYTKDKKILTTSNKVYCHLEDKENNDCLHTSANIKSTC